MFVQAEPGFSRDHARKWLVAGFLFWAVVCSGVSGYPLANYEGLPVMVRVDRGTFRTVHSNFTPLSLEPTTGQQMVDSVLSWLYEKWLKGVAEPSLGQLDGEVIQNLTGRKEP